MAGDGPAGHGPLSLRVLNRATLERQLLLRRAAMAPRQAVAHLVGLQAQAPLAPYVGLWTRLAGFRPQQLENLFDRTGRGACPPDAQPGHSAPPPGPAAAG